MEAESIGAFDAKNSFSELLVKASQGKETIVTKHGKPVAKIIPYKAASISQEEVLARIKLTREQIATRGNFLKQGETWKELAREGLR